MNEPWAVAQPIKQTRWEDALVAAASRAYIFYGTGAKGELVKWSGECPEYGKATEVEVDTAPA